MCRSTEYISAVFFFHCGIKKQLREVVTWSLCTQDLIWKNVDMHLFVFFSPGSFLGSWENSRLCRWCYNALTGTKSLWSWWVSWEGRCIRTLWFLKATESKEIKSNLVELLFCKLIATPDLFTPSQLIAHGSSRMFQNLFKNMSYKIQS